MTPLFDHAVRVPPHVVLRQLEDETVLLNLNNEMYYGLDAVATRMWRALTNSASVEAAFQSLLDEYDVAPDTLRHDLGKLVRDLAESGLLVLEPAEP